MTPTAGSFLAGLAVVAVLFAVIIGGVIYSARAQARRDRRTGPDAPTLEPIGPERPRGQAALVRGGDVATGDRVRVRGRDWTVSEVEPMGPEVRAWLVPAPSPDRRQVLDAEVRSLAAAVHVELDRVAREAVEAFAVPFVPEVVDAVTLRAREAIEREADMVRPWLVDVGVTSRYDLPAWAMPRARHVGDGQVEVDVTALAHAIAERHVYDAAE